MRFTSLIVELIRARPRLMVWIVLLLQAALWFVLPVALYRSPPPDLAMVLAYGREYQVGTDLGPPLAFWLGDLAFRIGGNHLFGVYLLAQLCSIAAFLTLYRLARAIVGGQQAVLAILLTMTAVAFSAPGVDYGPMVLVRPLWALLLLHSWQLMGQGRRNAWFAWSIDAGLLLLTTSAAIFLLMLVAGFALATERGRRTLRSFDPLFAVVVIVVLALPYMVWLLRADALALPPWPGVADLQERALHGAALLAGVLLSWSGLALLVVLNFSRFGGGAEEAPIIYRPPVDRLAREFVYCFALGPALGGSLISGWFDLGFVAGGTGVASLLSGLAVIVATGDVIAVRRERLLRSVWAAAVMAPALMVVAATLLQPWTGNGAVATSLPATEIAGFFSENFERRSHQPLRAVAGDPELAALIALGPGRPHLLLDAAPRRTPWLTPAQFQQSGGVVVWRALDTAGAPPAEIAQHFPGVVPELPQSFEWLIAGRQPPLRIGWALLRPKTP